MPAVVRHRPYLAGRCCLLRLPSQYSQWIIRLLGLSSMPDQLIVIASEIGCSLCLLNHSSVRSKWHPGPPPWGVPRNLPCPPQHLVSAQLQSPNEIHGYHRDDSAKVLRLLYNVPRYITFIPLQCLRLLYLVLQTSPSALASPTIETCAVWRANPHSQAQSSSQSSTGSW